MEALAASGEVGGARGAIFKQMAEMKKKIQLVEGERKAIFEDSEREKEENKERIKKLSDEIKQYKNEVKLFHLSHCVQFEPISGQILPFFGKLYKSVQSKDILMISKA